MCIPIDNYIIDICDRHTKLYTHNVWDFLFIIISDANTATTRHYFESIHRIFYIFKKKIGLCVHLVQNCDNLFLQWDKTYRRQTFWIFDYLRIFLPHSVNFGSFSQFYKSFLLYKRKMIYYYEIINHLELYD